MAMKRTEITQAIRDKEEVVESMTAEELARRIEAAHSSEEANVIMKSVLGKATRDDFRLKAHKVLKAAHDANEISPNDSLEDVLASLLTSEVGLEELLGVLEETDLLRRLPAVSQKNRLKAALEVIRDREDCTGEDAQEIARTIVGDN